MKAVTWRGRRKTEVVTVPDPRIVDPTDAVIQVTTTGLCGSDLHLYEVLGPFLDAGDILGHEPMGVVAEVGHEARELKAGDRVVVPFNVSCGTCFMCRRGLHSQCETTQVHEHGSGASLFGYTKLYGQVPGGQAEYLRVPFADTLPIRVPEGPPDERFVYLSDVLPTAWQAVVYADVPRGGSVAVLGLGPIGDMCTRVAAHRGAGQVIGIDLVPERLARLPDALASALMKEAGVDKLGALKLAIELVRRGGTISLSGVYGGAADPLPLLTMFDKQIQLRMGQANVHRWVDDLLPLLTDGDPVGVEGFATHHLPLDEAPRAYADFQKKRDNMVKVLFHPDTRAAAA
ncbi:alcohol dehydrogenase catalytic domain-containing protein [Streptomyces sp. NPDC046374]|uniref:alcohol dehydrogenase catalytic domain-containing protein n=1 Tax=Streptomyces sp. NPDC046374 TaxID=3154917 RepID=UPI0033C496A9